MHPSEISVISAAALAALQPYWPIIAKKAAEELGKGAPAAVGILWSAVRKRFSGEEAAKKALEQLLSDPQNPKLQAVVEWQLVEILKKDPAFAGELKGLLPEGGTYTTYQAELKGSGAIAQGPGAIAVGAGGRVRLPSQGQKKTGGRK